MGIKGKSKANYRNGDKEQFKSKLSSKLVNPLQSTLMPELKNETLITLHFLVVCSKFGF